MGKTAAKPAEKKPDPLRRVERARTAKRFVVGLLIGIAGVICFVRYVVLAHPVPWKMIDPENPRFNPAVFAFRDYPGTKELAPAARALFPPGTPKKTVDRILHDVGHADIKLFARDRLTIQYAYVYSVERTFVLEVLAWMVTPPDQDRRWFVLVKYDAGDRVLDVTGTVADHDEVGARAYNRVLTTQQQ